MVYNLIITARADELVDGLLDYLMNKLKSADAALHFMEELDALYSRLEDNPFQFPESADAFLKARGYREAFFSTMQYRAVFRVEEQAVYVVAVFHDLEDYPGKVEAE